MYNGRVGLDDEISRVERQVRGGDVDPELALRLSQLFLRADRPVDAHRTLSQAADLLGQANARVVYDAAGQIEVNPVWHTIREELERVGELAGIRERAERRRVLTGQLEASGLNAEEHDELIRLEVGAGVPVHGMAPSCPACRGPIAPAPPTDADGEPQENTIRCARSGVDGDLCRHTDAKGLFACPCCGLVVRAWNERKLKPDPFEPPMLQPEKAHCPLCNGGITIWKKHFLKCPKGRPAAFPVCGVCRKRGFHRRQLRCPRCTTVVGETPCMERRG